MTKFTCFRKRRGRTETQKGKLYTRLHSDQNYKIKRPQESHCFLKDIKQDTCIIFPYKAENLEEQEIQLAKAGLH